MKKLLFLGTFGAMCTGLFAINSAVTTTNIVENIDAVTLQEFPVYCDGVYAGDADTIIEAWELCS